MSKVLVLGSEGLIGRSIYESVRDTVGMDIRGNPDHFIDAFNPDLDTKYQFKDLIHSIHPIHIIDATYPGGGAWECYVDTWYWLCQWLCGHGGGSMVLMSSIFGVIGSDPRVYTGTDVPSTPLWYTFFKGGVISVTRQLAILFAPYGLRVNCISPGGVDDKHTIDPLFIDRYCERTPLGHMATPSDIAGVVAFLISPAANYITGQNIIVDGGRTIW